MHRRERVKGEGGGGSPGSTSWKMSLGTCLIEGVMGHGCHLAEKFLKKYCSSTSRIAIS